jgi:DNA-directed RNA polymerase specialized sigma24 family protein
VVAERLETAAEKLTVGFGWPVEVLMKAIAQVHPVTFAAISPPVRSLPMHPHGSITGVIQGLRSDDPVVRDAAARLIWDRYFRDLLTLARNNLDKRIRLRTSEEDVAQSMFKSFCLRQQRGEFELTGRDELWKLLVTITIRKARNAAKAQRRDKRDIAREQTLPGNDATGPADWVLEQMEAADPSPLEAAVLNEALELRLMALADPELREIALWRLEGYTNGEIAGRRECTQRSVERKLARIRSLWASYDDGGS